MQESNREPILSSGRLRSCGLGCLVALVLCVLLAVGLYYWAVTPGPQIESDAFIGRETVAVAYVSGLHEDPAFSATVQRTLRAVREFNLEQAQDPAVPSFFRWFLTRKPDVGERDVRKAIRDVPRDFAVLVERTPGSREPQIAVVANLNRFSRALHLAYSVATLFQGSDSVDGHRIFALDRKPTSARVAFVEDTLVWGQNDEVIRQILARQLGSEIPAAAPVARAIQLSDPRWNLVGSIDNQGDLLSWLWNHKPDDWKADFEPAEIEPLLRTIDSVEFGLDITDEGALEGFVDLHMDSARDADRIRLLVGEPTAAENGPPIFALEAGAGSSDLHGAIYLGDLEKRVRTALEKARKHP